MALFGKKNKGAATSETVTPPVATKPVGQLKPNPKPDVYTLLLGLSVAAMVITIVILVLNFNSYGTNPLSFPKG